ncbi:adenylate/guanylate cyclase domain-containing protein [Bradyrhizobium sp.]|uniref:adenylate/guanylate cyclase domain-containing protein n=1 Tax=Bradyrhizobium sp. TaxID=376 RepID=UPI003BB0A6BF
MTGERVERRLAAVLAADVAGYSRLMGLDEEGTLARLKIAKKTVVDPALASHRGRIVKTTGDGMLVEFASAVDAARSSLEVQRSMAEQNAAVPQDQRIEFRIGIHVGDIIFDDNDIFGDGVNIAARLEGISEPGGVCMSDDAYRQVRGKVEIACDDLGPQNLKNIAEPMQVWRVRLDGQIASKVQPGSLVGQAPALALPDKPSIAVLPFQNMSGDPEQEYFADGTVEEITTALSRFKSLFVIARNSSFTYKGRAVDIKQVGRELGVRYLVEGSVRKAAGRVRITGQLIEAATGAHLWADKFDGDMADMFELQDSVTRNVVGAIAPRLLRAEIELTQRKKPDSWTSYDHFMRGMALFIQNSAESNKEAISEFRKVLALDPGFGPAYARIAICIYQLRNMFLVPVTEQERIEALQMAARASELEPDDAYVLAITSFVFGTLNDEFERGAACAERAVAINPNLAAAWNARGWMSLHLGEPEIALDAFGRSLRLNPLDPAMVPRTLSGLAAACLVTGKYDDGVRWSEQALAQQPRNLLALIIFVGNARRAGREDDAKNGAARIRKLFPTLRGSDVRLMLRARKPEHRSLIEELIDDVGLKG